VPGRRVNAPRCDLRRSPADPPSLRASASSRTRGSTIRTPCAAREAPSASPDPPTTVRWSWPRCVERPGARPLQHCWSNFCNNKNDNSIAAICGRVATREYAGPDGRWDAILPDRRGTAEMAHLFHIDVNSVSHHKLSMLGGIVTPPQHFVSRPLTAAPSPATLRTIRPPGATGPAGPDHRPFSRRANRLDTHPREGNRTRPGRHQVRGEGGVWFGGVSKAGPWGTAVVARSGRSMTRRSLRGALNISDRAGVMPGPETGAIRR